MKYLKMALYTCLYAYTPANCKLTLQWKTDCSEMYVLLNMVISMAMLG